MGVQTSTAILENQGVFVAGRTLCVCNIQRGRGGGIYCPLIVFNEVILLNAKFHETAEM